MFPNVGWEVLVRIHFRIVKRQSIALSSAFCLDHNDNCSALLFARLLFNIEEAKSFIITTLGRVKWLLVKNVIPLRR